MSHLHLSLPLALASLLLLAGPATFAAPDKPLNEVIVDVEADGRPVAEVLRKLERDHGLNYVVAQRVMEGAGLVNVHLRQVSLEDALHAICMACGLKLQVRGRILILLPVRGTQPVPAPVRRKRAPEDSSRPKARPARADDFSTRPTRTGKRKESLARSVGEVLGVDVKTGRLQLDADGLKVDFYAPTAKEAGDPARAARMRSTLARLEVGHKVALEYQSVKGRLIIASLVGGTKVRDPGSSLARRKKGETPAKAAPRRGARKGVSGPRNPLQAPESTTAVPNGVLTGTFVDFADERARVKRGDGEIVSVYVPSHDVDLRAKILVVLERLKPGARVFFLFEGVDGRMVLKSTGITEVKAAPKKK